MWNPFKSKTTQSSQSDSQDDTSRKGDEKEKIDDMSSMKMNMLQKIAMKRLEKMKPEERDRMIQEALNPKNKEKLVSVIENMRKAGQLSDEQYKAAKSKLGF